jgi:hypothetical protein
MAIAFVGSVADSGSNPTVSLNGLGTVTEGSLLVLITTGGTLTTPTGWTQIYAQGAGRNLTVCIRYVGAQTFGAADFLALTLTNSVSRVRILSYTGAGNYNAIATVATGSGTTATTNTQTTTYANDYVVSIFTTDTSTSSTTFTVPGGTTSRGNSSATISLNGLLVVDELKATAGVTTARSSTLSNTENWAAISISFVETRTNVYWVGGAGTWNISSIGNWSNSSGGATTGVVPPGGSENAIIDTSSGTGTITCTGGLCDDLTVTASQAIVLGAAASTLRVSGNLSFPSGGSFSASTNANTITLASFASKTVTTNGKSFSSITLDGVFENETPTYVMPSAITATGTATLTSGTLDIGTNTSTLSCAAFSSSNTTTRAITFGTGNITTTGSGTAWTTATATNFTYTGTPTVNISNNSATATTVTAGTTGGASTNALNFNFTVGTYALTLTTASNVNSLNFTGFTGTWAPGTATYNIFGSVTLVSGMTYTTGTSVWSLVSPTATQVITSGGKSLYSITQNQTSTGSVQFAAGTTTLTNAYTFTDGTLDVGTNTATLSCLTFSSSNSNTRSITFGTGAINVTGNATTVIDFTTMTNFTFTGTSNFNCTYSGSTGTRTISLSPFNDGGAGGTSSNALNINITAGSDTILPLDGNIFRNWVWTGYTGTFNHGGFNYTLYGDFTTPAAMTWNSTGGGTLTFSGSTTKTITTNGETIGDVTINSSLGTVLLGSDLTLGTTKDLIITAGTFNANNYNVTVGRFASSNTNTRTITMGSGTWTLADDGAVWNVATTTNLTFNKNTANIVLSDTSNNARSFAGGSLTYNNLTIGGSTGTSTLTITGTNTFATLASTKTVAHTITFPNVTTTVSDWTISGSAGNIVTLQRTGASGTWSIDKTGGGEIVATFLTVSNSAASPAATWYADTSTDGGGNTGWLFNSRGTSQMFMLF